MTVRVGRKKKRLKLNNCILLLQLECMLPSMPLTQTVQVLKDTLVYIFAHINTYNKRTTEHNSPRKSYHRRTFSICFRSSQHNKLYTMVWKIHEWQYNEGKCKKEAHIQHTYINASTLYSDMEWKTESTPS